MTSSGPVVLRAGVAWLSRFVSHFLRELQRLEPFDRAMTLAAQAFTSILPLVITTFSVLGRDDWNGLADRVADVLALPSGTRSALEGLSVDTSAQVATFGVLSLLMVLVSATSCSRALTRMYAKAWSVPTPGWRQGWRWVAAIVLISTSTVTVRSVLGAAAENAAGTAAAGLLALVVNAVLWTVVPSLLLAGQVPWRRLAPAGVLMGAATLPLFSASRVYMPWALTHAHSTYGDLGVAFVFIGWLFCVAFVLIVATVLGSALAGVQGATTSEPAPAVARAG